jgi:hypothetical protein
MSQRFQVETRKSCGIRLRRRRPGHGRLLRRGGQSRHLRPAEKLYKELLIGTNVSGTEHPMIMRAVKEYQPNGEVVDSVWCRRESERRLQAKVTNLQIRRSAGRREPEAAAD